MPSWASLQVRAKQASETRAKQARAKQGQALRYGWSRNAFIAVVANSAEIKAYTNLIQIN
jgi:hypothetical protein